MSVLSNIEYILIKASYGQDYNKAGTWKFLEVLIYLSYLKAYLKDLAHFISHYPMLLIYIFVPHQNLIKY